MAGRSSSDGYAGSTGYEEQYVYDSTYGELADTRRRIENEWIWVSQTYDSLGRLDVLKYPNSVSASTASDAGSDSERVRVKHHYNGYGYLNSVSDAAASTVYWTAVSNSAGGAILREDLGNGLATLRTVDRASGHLEALTTGPGVSATVQNLEFDWDKAGNLKVRRDLQANKKEEFDYDGLYRLAQARLYATASGSTPSSTDNFTYDTLGNLTNKGGASGAHTFSNYNYGTRTGCANTAVRPHAVYQVTVGAGTRRYCYDANGNLTTQTIASGSGAVRYDTSTWWVANLAKRISQGTSAASEFWYGPGRERIRQLAQKSTSTTENTLYVGGLYEKMTRTVSGSPTTEHVHYVRAGGQAIAVVKRVSGALQTRYLHRDHLGSVVALTDTTGAVIERHSYDPWGKRRDPSSWVTPAPGTFGFDPSYGDRGYTGHEHIDHLGLVNMNGRIYDPELGKFLSADPTTQFPESTQGWNRYTYAGNNPLSYTDPSGFSFLKTVMQVVGIVLNFIPVIGNFASAAWYNAMLVGFASGFLASGGDLKAGLIGAATAGLMNGIGSQYQGLMDSKCFSDAAMIGMKVEKAFLEGVVGGAASALNKGDFRDGFLGAASGSLAGSFAKLSSNRVVATAQAAAIGGTVSTIGGGKFGNGAITATFAYVYNSLAHPTNTYEAGVRQAILRGDVAELEALLGNGTLSAQDALIAQRALTAMQTVGAENSSLLASRYGVDWVNKVGHIFDGIHQGPVGQALLRQFGSPAEAMAQVQRALEVARPSTGWFSNTFNTSINVQGVAVQVRGRIVDGIYRIGTIEKW